MTHLLTSVLYYRCDTTATKINFEAITNLMHKYLYSYIITILYMFRASLCSSSGGTIVYVQHLVPSLSVSGHMAAHRQWWYQMLYIYNCTSWRWA